MSFTRTKEVPPGSGNYYAYRVFSESEGGGQEYLGKASEVEEVEVPESSETVTAKKNDGREDEEDSQVEGMNEEAVKQLTRQGTMVEKDAAEILTMEDVDLIKSLDATPMFVSQDMVMMLRGRSNQVQTDSKQKVRILKETPDFMGVDGETYSAQEGKVLELPEDNAEILVNRGNAEYLEDQEKQKTTEKEEEVPKNEEDQENDFSDLSQEQREAAQDILEDIPKDDSIHIDNLREQNPYIFFDEVLDKLKARGEVYEPKQHHVQSI